jgi:hypothetical protein
MKLFPNYTKRIGAVLSILVVISMIIIRQTIPRGPLSLQMKTIWESLLLLGLFLMVLSKEKIEDEFIAAARLRAAAGAFLSGLVAFIANNTYTWFDFGSPATVFGCLLSEVLFYLAFFNLSIRGKLHHDQ